MSDAYEQVEVVTAAELRAWLEEHAGSSPGVWLVTYKKAAGERYLAYEDIVRGALCFGWIDGKGRALDALRSQLLLTPRRPRSGWSRPNKLRVADLEAAGLMAPAGRVVVAAAMASNTWTALDDVEDLVEPLELREALDAVPAARASWDAFPRSTRRAVLERLSQAKRPATRERQVADVVDRAARNERP